MIHSNFSADERHFSADERHFSAPTFARVSKCMVLVWKFYAKTAKFQAIELENKGQGHVRLTDVRLPNVPC